MPEGDFFNRSHEFYLSDISEKDNPWDKHRAESDAIARLYRRSQFPEYAERIEACSNVLGFNHEVNPETGETKLKLNSALFCRVRHCPICQWRRTMMWRSRCYKAFKKIVKDYPNHRYLLLTLTVRNPPVDELRDTLTWMNQSWKRLIQKTEFPAVGYVRSTEVTRSDIGYAHPHFHAILMVPESYFKKGYICKDRWIQLWREAGRMDYDSSLKVKAVPINSGQGEKLDAKLVKALCECVKYSVKPSDLAFNVEWLEKITIQLHKTRSFSLGGIVKNYLSEKEPENLISDNEPIEDSSSDSLYFSWQQKVQKYLTTIL